MVRCLKYNPSERPTAEELKQAFQEEISSKIPPFDPQAVDRNVDIEKLRKPAPTPAPSITEVYKTLTIKWRTASILIFKPQIISKHLLRKISVDLYSIVSENCFEFLLENKEWKIKGLPPEPGKEKVYLNGEDITNKVKPVKSGDKIKIGNFEILIEGNK